MTSFGRHERKPLNLKTCVQSLLRVRLEDSPLKPKKKSFRQQNQLQMADFRISEKAREDLIRIYLYGLREFGESQADLYFENFFRCFNRISENPLAFESVDQIRTGYRRCPCGSDSIFYRIQADQVEIMAIVGRQEINHIL